MQLFKKKASRFYWYDFNVRGQRYRGSTKQTNRKRAEKVAALKLSQMIEGNDHPDRKPPTLGELSDRFLKWVDLANLAQASRKYYRYGWRMLSNTKIVSVRIDQITKDDVEALKFAGSGPNVNCARRTLRRMLHKAEEWGLLSNVPRFKLLQEHGRTLRLDDDFEKKLLTAAKACSWRPRSFELFRDIIILARDTGMRNRRELFRIRIEDLDWNNGIIFVPDSKTPEGRRLIPMSDRAYQVLRIRAGERSNGWLFPSNRSRSGHLMDVANRFREVRQKAGLAKDLVLYCSRHDFGTRLLESTGNLAAVMKTMGHSDVRAALRYQHPDFEIVRAAINQPGRLTQDTNL